MESNIRRMRIEDLPQVQSIEELSFPTPWSPNAFRFELLENPNSHCWVAEFGELLAGFIVCWLIVDEMHIASIAVHPKFRGKGISKKLIIMGLRELISKGAISATLEVRAGNTKAQYLYRYFGFEEVGLRKAYYKDTHEDALLMTVEPLDSEYLDWLNSGALDPRKN
ncbi:MAG: ribosomal protein S18-alanine N-acetyltransferase [Anaerolineales bacterium]|jgi:ribosomal-protein-alanine N-acetyltransferase